MSLLNLLCLAPHKAAGGGKPSPPAPETPQKWLPVIDRDSCLGCERCVAVCEHGSLEMIWSFATLTNPHSCTGEGLCTQACPQQIIRMAWVPVEPSGSESQPVASAQS
jgi:NAD-dependent dihydropyrimidine dehydrogenase PreA subunit